jgi:hypothetical protein
VKANPRFNGRKPWMRMEEEDVSKAAERERERERERKYDLSINA